MISLSKYDVSFLLMTLLLTPDLRQVLEAIAEQGGQITDDQADELRDCCTDRLDKYGFDESYEPTTEGKKLESLIDKLYVG